MLNTTKMYLYRLRYSKCLKICALLSLFLIVTGILGQFLLDFIVNEIKDEELAEEMASGGYSEVSTVLEEFLSFLCSGLISVLGLIFISVFTAADEKKGYIKNILSVQKRRSYIILPRLLSLGAALLVLFTVAFAGILVMYILCYKFDPGFSADTVLRILYEYILIFVFLAFVQMLALVSKGTAFPIAFGVVCAVNLPVIFSDPVNSVVSEITGSDSFDLSDYFITMYISYADIADKMEITRSLIVAAVYLTVTVLISVAVLEKRDVR